MRLLLARVRRRTLARDLTNWVSASRNTTNTTAQICLLAAALGGCTNDALTTPSPTEVRTVEVAADTLTAIDQSVQVTAIAKDASGTAIPGLAFTWSSSNQAVVAINTVSGLATAKANGVVTVTATAGGRSGTAELRVAQEVVSVDLTPTSWDPTWIGARQAFAAMATDANGHTVPDKKFVWASLDPAVARIDTAGVATAMSTGSTELSASVDSLRDVVSISVTNTGSAGNLDGVVYTVWFARSDSAPAMLVDGALVTPFDFYTAAPGDAKSPWTGNNVAKFQWEGDRLGLLTDVVGGTGNLRVRDRASEWTNLAIGNAADFQLEGQRIGLRSGSGEFRVKDGINGPWTVLATSGAAEFQLSGDRIGLLSTAGEFRVKDGINGPWTVLAAGGAAKFELSGDRIGLLSTSGEFRVKDGIGGAWTVLAASGIQHVELESDRIGLLSTSGEFRVKDGINGAWTVLAASGAEVIQLQENMVGMLSTNGTLSIKTGIHGGWTETTPSGDVTQIRLMVDVPAPAFRTTLSSYAAGQSNCILNYSFDDCITPFDEKPIAPWYGWYCGADRGGGGLIDGMDATCRHHDNVEFWYPEILPGFNGWDVAEAVCIVRYGLEFSRLTRDGVLLTDGSELGSGSWDAAWGTMMPNLKAILDRYSSAVNLICTQTVLTNFIEKTAWKGN